MKFKDFLQEEYDRILKSNITKKPFEVFKNPSGKEIMEVGRVDGSVRWVVNAKEKVVYIWPGNGDLHENVIPQIDEPKIKFSDSVLGSGIPRAGKIEVGKHDNFKVLPKQINLKEWSFADHYFVNGITNIIKEKTSGSQFVEVNE